MVNRYYGRSPLFRRVVFTLFLTLAIALSAPAKASEEPAKPYLEKVKIIYSSISGTMAPAWIAYEAGFFRKYGLDVDLVFVEGGSKAVQSLLGADIALAQIAGAAVLQANLKGSDTVLIAGFLNTMNYQFMVSQEVTRPEHLKGKAVAVSRFGGSSDFATRYVIEKFGLVPQKDVTFLEIGTQSDRLAALQDGTAQGVMLAVPHTLEAKRLGFSALADLQTLGLEYQHTGLAVSRSLIESRRDLILKVIKAYVEGIHYYKTHRQESMEILSKYLKSADPEALAETYEVLGLTLLPEKPYPTLKGIRTILQRLAKKYPEAATAQPERFVDLTFVRELDSSGFIERVYKTVPVAAQPKPQPPPTIVKEEVPSPEDTTEMASRPKTIFKEQVEPAPALSSPVSRQSNLTFPGEEYLVRAGDTLSQLSDRFYGSKYKWNIIYEANRGIVENPNLIYVGQKILIPFNEGTGRGE